MKKYSDKSGMNMRVSQRAIVLQPHTGSTGREEQQVWDELRRLALTTDQAGPEGIDQVDFMDQDGETVVNLRYRGNMYWALTLRSAFQLFKKLPDNAGLDQFWAAVDHKWKKPVSQQLKDGEAKQGA